MRAGADDAATGVEVEQLAEIEVVLVATVVGGRFHRLWELTWPDWSRLRAFDSYDSGADAGSADR